MQIIHDPRKINSICLEGESYVQVGKNGCIEITPYLENGEMAGITWFSTHYENGDNVKYNSKYVNAVVYKGQSKGLFT